MASVVDANLLVYGFDSRFPAKLKAAEDLLFQGIADGALRGSWRGGSSPRTCPTGASTGP